MREGGKDREREGGVGGSKEGGRERREGEGEGGRRGDKT